MNDLWVLAWFVASIGVSVASPLIHPQSIEVICSGAGTIKWMVQTEGGAVEMGSTNMDCPLCAPSTGAPPAPAAWAPPPSPAGPCRAARAGGPHCGRHGCAAACARPTALTLTRS